ncbi:hypothetical protein AWH62_05915 [Maricaulis sp. W15]|uniref:hypothetical protein n=1 Tax=Maricaulis sp. W15 TaxID=1772333 RepID=UPI000948FB92|nr:hypothetical protein [Maricaulis sp. W15]OLF75357.1 hypothetical protein AWH62_05915 [Maricaulis sp. W15]
MTRRRFLDRTRRNREEQARSGKSFNPATMIRLAFFGVALVVAAAVYVGFWRQGETIYDGPWGLMQRLITPLFLGINALELIVVALVALVAWRIWRRL